MQVVMKNTTRLCSTKSIVTVNGKFPGPTIYAREDDTVLIRVINRVKYNVSIHWQLRTGWADGPAYITQCPIRPGHSYVATLHGALVILPKLGVPYPFPKPDHEAVVVLGELIRSSFYVSPSGFSLNVAPGKTYMLRLINAALNEELFFKIAGHKLTVVEVDATYVKPFKIDTILIAPGQTTNVIVAADKGVGKYMVAASPFMDTPAVAVDNMTATATLHYSGTLANSPTSFTSPPAKNATPVANNFINSLRSLNSKKYPAKVPQNVDHSLFFAVGLGINPCPTCKAGNGSRVVASINNVTFVMPTIALLQAHVFNIKGVFTTDFPGNPPSAFNYTGTPPANLGTTTGTKLYRLPYNATVQVVLQDTGIIAPENHPVHLHGFNFFAVGRGLGNFNPKTDSKNFNLNDPVERNTIGVPSGGWVALRFQADNPGKFKCSVTFLIQSFTNFPQFFFFMKKKVQ
ncbi:hypothetical protein Pfo_030455 [Paulownia fortunei]|nr:hypothetical protein Pfo_030455 [Paulownia fortunei]